MLGIIIAGECAWTSKRILILIAKGPRYNGYNVKREPMIKTGQNVDKEYRSKISALKIDIKRIFSSVWMIGKKFADFQNYA